MPDDLSEFVAQKHNGLHQTTEVLVEVKPNCSSQYNIEANSEHNIAHHSSLSSVRHQNHDSLDLDNSVSPNLKQTQAISNAHLTTFLHSLQATIDFSQTLNLSKAHFTPHLIKTISYFLLVPTILWLGLTLLEEGHLGSQTQTSVQTPLPPSGQVIAESIDSKVSDESNKLKEQLNKKGKVTHRLMNSETNQTIIDTPNL